MKLLMTAYQSAEEGRTLEFPPRGLEGFAKRVGRQGGGVSDGRAAEAGIAVPPPPSPSGGDEVMPRAA